MLVGLGLPALVVQDACRYAAFSCQRPATAMALDGLWAIAAAAGVLYALTVDAGASAVILIWIAGAAIPTTIYLLSTRIRIDLRLGLAVLRRQWAIGWRFAAEFWITYSGSFVPFVLLGTFGLAEAGTVRAAFTALAPMNVLVSAAVVGVAPRLRTEGRTAPVGRTALALSLGLGGIALAYSAALLALPDHWGAKIFGETWSSSAPLLLLLGGATVIAGLGVGPMVVARAGNRADLALRVAYVCVVPSLLAPVAGALLASSPARGFALGWLVQAVFTAVVWWAVTAPTMEDRP